MITRVFNKTPIANLNLFRIVLLIVLIGFYGISLFLDILNNEIPIWLAITDYLLVMFFLGFSFYRERIEFQTGVLKGYGRKKWMGAHILIGLVLGLGFLFMGIFDYLSDGFGFNNFGIIGLISITLFIKNISGYYIVLSDDSVTKDNLIYYNFQDIQSVKIEDDKIALKVKNLDKYIYFRFFTESEKMDLIADLDNRLYEYGNKPNRL